MLERWQFAGTTVLGLGDGGVGCVAACSCLREGDWQQCLLSQSIFPSLMLSQTFLQLLILRWVNFFSYDKGGRPGAEQNFFFLMFAMCCSCKEKWKMPIKNGQFSSRGVLVPPPKVLEFKLEYGGNTVERRLLQSWPVQGMKECYGKLHLHQ